MKWIDFDLDLAYHGNEKAKAEQLGVVVGKQLSITTIITCVLTPPLAKS